MSKAVICTCPAGLEAQQRGKFVPGCQDCWLRALPVPNEAVVAKLQALRADIKTYEEAVEQCRQPGYLRFSDQPAVIAQMLADGVEPVFYYRKVTKPTPLALEMGLKDKVEYGFVGKVAAK